MSQKNNIEKFLKRHDVKVLDTNKRAARYQHTSYDFFKYEKDYNLIDSKSHSFQTEPLYTVEIPESELDRIANFEDQVFNNLAERGHFNMFETLMEQKAEEQYLRETYPAVRKAYEHYSLLLKMAKSGEL